MPNEHPSDSVRSRGVDLNSLLTEISGILRTVVHSGFNLQTRLDPKLGRVDAPRTQLNWLFVNLVVTAYDTLRQDGKFVITTADRHLDEAAAAEMGLAPGRYVQVELNMTTDGRSPGATALEIIRQAGGRIREKDAGASGKTLTVVFPSMPGA
jgi:hypothetical protein